VKIKITVEKGRDSSDALKRLSDRLIRAARDGTSDALHAVEREAKINTVEVFRHPTGHLAGSIRVERVKKFRRSWAGKVGPTLVYSRIQELGGTISPNKGRFLRWVDADGVHFARHVTLKPHPYLKPAADEVRPSIPDIYRARLARALAE